jgi:hypothetical protein
MFDRAREFDCLRVTACSYDHLLLDVKLFNYRLSNYLF